MSNGAGIVERNLSALLERRKCDDARKTRKRSKTKSGPKRKANLLPALIL